MLTSGTGVCTCTPQTRAMCTDDCTDDGLVAWAEPCTRGTPCTTLPEGKFSTQNTALATAAHQNNAAQAPGQSLALRGADKICNMAGL